MSRILLAGNDKWFDELRSVAYYREADLEKWIHQHSKSLFPHHFVFPFKKDVVGKKSNATKTPDLAMIRDDFSAWTLIEVEVRGHGLEHVLDQVGVFVDGNYNAPEMAEYSQKQLKKFCDEKVTLPRLTNLFSEKPPSVLVITDTYSNDWRDALNRIGVEFCIFEVYKNVHGNYAYRTYGHYPKVPAESAHCRPLQAKPNIVEVIGNFNFIEKAENDVVDIVYNEFLTRWGLIKDGNKQYLQFVGISNPLSANSTYSLFRDKADKYYFQRS
jgi:hypothetical protein